MGIIALLLVATLPAFNGFGTSQNRRGAVGNLMGALDHARMMAISDGLPTYVAFACKSNAGQQVNTNLWGRAYAIFQDKDNVNFQVVQRTAWMYLPNNVAFKVDPARSAQGTSGSMATVTNQDLANSSDANPTFTVTGSALPNGTTGSLGVQLPYWKFDNTGMVTQKAILASADTSPNNADYYRLFLFTGSVDGNGTEISTQNNGGKNNTDASRIEEIDINPVTGRAKYIVDPLNNLATPTPTPGSSS